MDTRPISDRVKESLFNLLRGHIEDAAFIDLFAGTGSIGLEALSRGASNVLFVERDRKAIARLKQNIETLDVADECTVSQADALGPLWLNQAPQPAHIITMDPPYALLRDPESTQLVINQMDRVASLLDDDGYLILRTEWPYLDRDIPAAESLLGPETHDYKSMALHFYQRKSE